MPAGIGGPAAQRTSFDQHDRRDQVLRSARGFAYLDRRHERKEPDRLLALPTTGDINYTRTVTIPQGVADAIRNGNAAIIVHGIDYNHNGVYDNVLDRSELSNSLTGESTAPALCGRLVPSQTASVTRGGTVTDDLRVRARPPDHGLGSRRQRVPAALPPPRDQPGRGDGPAGRRRQPGLSRRSRTLVGPHLRQPETMTDARIHGCSVQM